MSVTGQSTPTGYQFGTFKGVFTPSVLTILGVVMYLRMGWVLGNVGLPATLAIVTLASAITFFTALSLAALATNMKVRGGGAYYVISRSLGVEGGAAIGMPLYLAQSLGVAFYIAGFSESLVQMFPGFNPTTVGVITLVGLTVVVYVSADLALKTQFLIMAAIAVSLVSFFLGRPVPPAEIGIGPLEFEVLTFWPVFAVFFPAVTGIEAGIAMSGDLKDPARSLPRGTISAVLVGYAVYIAIPVMLANAEVPRAMLLTDPLVMQKSARWDGAVLVGIWAAALSSAMGALLGAPRTLQALARDRVIPRVIARGYGTHNDPRLATAISFAIALVGILLGDMNAIAPILSMFFLTSYGVLNLSAGFETLISNPAWRPKFRTPAWVSLAGFAACLGAMLMLAPGATIIAIIISAAIYVLMMRRRMQAQWGDMRVGLMMFFTRLLLQRMAGRALDERTWKPNLLVFSGSPRSRWYLIDLANAIAQGRSFVTVAAFIPEVNWTAARARTITNAIRTYLGKRSVRAFIRTLPANDPYAGAATMIRAYGFGPIVPNTVLIGETETPSSYVRFAELIQIVARSNRNLVIVRERSDEDALATPPAPRSASRRIDVWWSRLSSDTAFLLALAILLKRSHGWSDTELRFMTTVESPAEQEGALTRLRQFLADARVDAIPDVLVRNGREVFEVIRATSASASLVFLAVRAPGDTESAEEYSRYYAKQLEETDQLPPTALVMAAEKLDFLRLFESEEFR